MKHTCETVHDGNLCIYCGKFVEQNDFSPSNSKSEDTLKESNNLNTSEEHIKDNVINGGSL